MIFKKLSDCPNWKPDQRSLIERIDLTTDYCMSYDTARAVRILSK